MAIDAPLQGVDGKNGPLNKLESRAGGIAGVANLRCTHHPLRMRTKFRCRTGKPASFLRLLESYHLPRSAIQRLHCMFTIDVTFLYTVHLVHKAAAGGLGLLTSNQGPNT